MHLDSCQLRYRSLTRYHSSRYRGFTDITVPPLRYRSHRYRELRYHSTKTPISEYQYSDIDSDIGGAVISEVRPPISEYYTSDIGVDIGRDIGTPDITAGCIRYRRFRYHINSDHDISIPDITESLILLRASPGGPDKGLLTPTLDGVRSLCSGFLNSLLPHGLSVCLSNL